MSVLANVTDWDTWAMERTPDITLPIKLWYSDVGLGGDGSGGSLTVTFILPAGGQPGSQTIGGGGQAFGLMKWGAHLSGGVVANVTGTLEFENFNPLPGGVTRDRAIGIFLNSDGLNRAGVLPRDLHGKIWLGHKAIDADGHLIFRIPNVTGQTLEPSVFLCEWTPEAYQAGGPKWPAMAG